MLLPSTRLSRVLDKLRCVVAQDTSEDCRLHPAVRCGLHTLLTQDREIVLKLPHTVSNRRDNVAAFAKIRGFWPMSADHLVSLFSVRIYPAPSLLTLRRNTTQLF